MQVMIAQGQHACHDQHIMFFATMAKTRQTLAVHPVQDSTKASSTSSLFVGSLAGQLVPNLPHSVFPGSLALLDSKEVPEALVLLHEELLHLAARGLGRWLLGDDLHLTVVAALDDLAFVAALDDLAFVAALDDLGNLRHGDTRISGDSRSLGELAEDLGGGVLAQLVPKLLQKEQQVW